MFFPFLKFIKLDKFSGHLKMLLILLFTTSLIINDCLTLLADFDEDKELGRNDLHKTLRCLSRNELTEEEMSFVVNKVRFEFFYYSGCIIDL